MLDGVSFFLVGDIHYPESKDSLTGDVKDKKISESMTRGMVKPRLPHIFKHILGEIDEKRCDGILFCGDLTTNGDMDGYRACVEYLFQNFGAKLKSNGNFFYSAVPGNHDIQRSSFDQEDYHRSVDDLQKIWSINTDLKLPAKDRTVNDIATEGVSRCKIISVNSCCGCWTPRRAYPDEVGDKLNAAIEDWKKAATKENIDKLLYEHFDAPFVNQQDISAINSDITNLEQTCMPIILAHHNILPQAVPRLAPYAEMVNSGALRSSLAERNRPILYCHGHLHEFFVHSVTHNHKSSAPLVIVAAPQASGGVVKITIQHGANGCPVGCIIRYRPMEDYGELGQEVLTRIPLATNIGGRLTAHEQAIVKTIDSFSRTERIVWQEFFGKFQKETKVVGPQPEREVARSLLEREWKGMINILNRDDISLKNWQIERVGS